MKKTFESLEKVKNGDVSAWWTEWKKMKHAEKYGANRDTLIKWCEWLKELTTYFNEDMLLIHPVFNKYKNGEVVTNNFGKKLYFKMGEK